MLSGIDVARSILSKEVSGWSGRSACTASITKWAIHAQLLDSCDTYPCTYLKDLDLEQGHVLNFCNAG